MKIGKDSVVSFHYRLHDGEGNLLESSEGGDPSLYLHGHGAILPALESRLLGLGAGERVRVALEPHQAYGPRREDGIKRIPLKHLQGQRSWKPGAVARVHTDRGWRNVTVLKVGRYNADVDSNHPLAGKALEFDIEVIEVRPATQDEVAHGHVHGPGGVHH
ncbi:MAG: peptidylprolyl isomerase [Pseudomonadota bacterium]|nr:peptidylprolyl isomerase [Pseudomonadota bacterium]